MDLIDKLRTKMRAATQLTRHGDLQAATAEIQRALGENSQTAVVPESGRVSPQPTIDVAFRVIDEPARTRPEPKAPPSADGGTTGTFLPGSFSNAAGSREYKLYVPRTPRAQSLPLIVMLHGCTQTPDDFAAGTRMNSLAERHDCLVLYPAQSQSGNGSRCWNWFRTADQQREHGEPSLIAGMTRHVMTTHTVDPAQVYVAGLSAGGAMAQVMGVTHPELYAAVGVHSGLAYAAANDLSTALAAMRQGGPRAPAKMRPQRVVPTIVFHGNADRTVHPDNADRIIEQWLDVAARTGSLDARPVAASTEVSSASAGGRAYGRTVFRNASGRAVLEKWLVDGAAHAWIGGSPNGTCTDPQGPDASAEMLRFFREHPHTVDRRSTV